LSKFIVTLTFPNRNKDIEQNSSVFYEETLLFQGFRPFFKDLEKFLLFKKRPIIEK